MANQISVSVYNFSTGMKYDSRVDNRVFIRENIASIQAASVYDYTGTQYTDVRGKITENWGGELKDYYVHQTPAQIKTLLDA